MLVSSRIIADFDGHLLTERASVWTDAGADIKNSRANAGSRAPFAA
jgi:hypothetical protein